MRTHLLIGAIALTAALALPAGLTQAQVAGKYPDWKGQWTRVIVRGLGGQGSQDQTKPWGFGQQAPLTPEYQAVLEASIADQAAGGLGNFPTARCYPAGMPHMMMAFGPQEYVITPDTTYILIDWDDHNRRIFTDGRDWPEALEPTFSGYSIGRWIDEDGDGVYDMLEVETPQPAFSSGKAPSPCRGFSLFGRAAAELPFVIVAVARNIADRAAADSSWRASKSRRRRGNSSAGRSRYWRCSRRNNILATSGADRDCAGTSYPPSTAASGHGRSPSSRRAGRFDPTCPGRSAP